MGEHINTFEKGLNSDFNILYQPEGTYRFLKNCSLIAQDGNNYVIKDCLGNTKIFNINTRYNGDKDHFDVFPLTIGFISFPDKLIIFSTNDESSVGGYGEIGMIQYLPYGEGITPKAVVGQLNSGYIPLYNSVNLKFTKLHQIEGFAYQETEDLQRVYWTDNFNQPRVLNIGDTVYTTYISSGSLVVNTEYMVLEGVIEHPVGSGTFYGPGVTAGNTFTASTTTYTASTGTSPTPKVIVYVPFELLYFTPSRYLGGIQFSEYGTGTVLCGNKMYFYRLSLADGSYISPWSYGSGLIHVGTPDNGGYPLTGNTYLDFSGGGTVAITLQSPYSVKVQIDNIDTKFGTIELAVAEFDQSDTVLVYI